MRFELILIDTNKSQITELKCIGELLILANECYCWDYVKIYLVLIHIEQYEPSP
jgi:hypothetical protein